MARTRLVASTAASAACAAAALMGCCLALLAVTVPSALASARPGTPDDFLGLLLWAQAASERAAAAAASAPAVAMEAAVAAAPPPPPPSTARQLAVDWRDKHRALFRKASEGGASADGGSGLPPKKAQPAAKKHAPASKTTTSAAPAPTTATAPTPVTSTATAVPAPALWAPEESVSRAAVPALEEYDRSERFGHSFVHGFRPF
ncbi:hypothetical protein R5R35_001705 [Gryllus longicercus]|uniref:Uncharacterized protein n=1 Tax=Gryllus longicercus TaxID=2509291 RepID=A0AAN9VXG0_9ORTH